MHIWVTAKLRSYIRRQSYSAQGREGVLTGGMAPPIRNIARWPATLISTRPGELDGRVASRIHSHVQKPASDGVTVVLSNESYWNQGLYINDNGYSIADHSER